MTLDPNRKVVSWSVLDCIVDISVKLEGTIMDWPANIQDAILDQLEIADIKFGLSHEVVMSKCDYDIDRGWFVHVVARAPRYGLIQ